MIRKITFGILASYFFIFLVNNLSMAYDRYSVQFLVLSIVNIIAFVFVIKNYSFKEKLNSYMQVKPIIFYAGFILLSGLSIIIANNKAESIIVFSQYLTFFFALIIIYLIARKSGIKFQKVFIIFCLISIVLEASYVLFIFIDNTIVKGEIFYRTNVYKGFTANINIAAFSLVAKSPAALYCIFKNKNFKQKLFGIILIFMTASSLSILLSRGAFIAFVTIIILMIIYSLIKKIDNNFLSISFIILPVILSYLLFSNLLVTEDKKLINERIASIQIDGEDQSINERLRFYEGALESIKKSPVLGIGIGNWKIESIKYDSKYTTGYRIPFHAHNDVLQIASESGIFASIFFMLFLIYPFYIFIRDKIYMSIDLKYFCVLLMMVVYILDTLINFPISRPISHIFLIFVSVTLIFIANKNEENNI